MNAMPALHTYPAVTNRTQLGLTLTLVAIVSLWLYGWAGNFALTLEIGRYVDESVHPILRSTPLASAIFKATTYVPILALVAAIGVSLGGTRTAPLHHLGALLAPWVVLYPIFYFARDMQFARQDILFPLLVTAIYLARPTISQISKLIAILSILTAAISVTIGIFAPSAALMPMTWNTDKAIIGSTFLAGSYGHSNQLGTVLALGVPFIVCVYKGFKRNICLALIAVALIWSASRSSILSVIVFFIILLMTRKSSSPRSRTQASTILIATIFAAIAIAFWLTLTTADPTAYTNRGKIWQTSLDYWSRSPWVGWGPDILSKRNALTIDIGTVVNHSHDVWLTFATTGGLVTLILIIIAGVVIALRATAIYRYGEALPLLFIVMLVILCIAEDPVRALHAGPQSFIVWTGLALTFCTPSRSPFDPERANDDNNVTSEMP